MALPSPALSVPTLSSDQIQFQGLVLGNGTVFGVTKLEGYDKPDVRSGNQDRPRTRGAFVGSNLLKTRTITVTLDVGPFGAGTGFGSYSNVQGALGALRTATSTEGSTEYPLWIKLPNLGQVCCLARVIKSNVPYDYVAERGLVRGVAVQFEATDPYLYAAPTTSQTVGLPTPGVGFTFPITFNLSFGGGTSPNQATVVNNGDVTCWPVLVITGPCLNPVVQNTSVTGNPALYFNTQLYAGDQLIVDCDMQSILFYPSGSTVGAPAQQILQPGSTFFGLPPGSSIVGFNSADTTSVAGTLSVWSASAYDGLV